MIEQLKKDTFFTMVDSLKKSRRANLQDISDDDLIIEKLYTDPLDNNLVLEMCKKRNTTILIGRKGTGKSTIIARLQHEIRKSNDIISLYLDVKSIYEQSKSFSFDDTNYQGIMSKEDLQTYLVAKSFLCSILEEVKREVKTNTLKYQWNKFSNLLGIKKKSFEDEIDQLFIEIDELKFNDVTLLKQKNLTKSEQLGLNFSTAKGVTFESDMSFNPTVSLNYNDTNDISENRTIQSEFSEVLLRYFNMKAIMDRLKTTLSKVGIKTVFICLDDFSEIELDPMKIFVETIVAPLNNWSEEFFKFKISAYPGRIYLGEIDPTKIEQVKLDYYDLYKSFKVTETESLAGENIKRLLENRSQYFCQCSFSEFIDPKINVDDFYNLLFKISSNVPRNLGWILWYANKRTISLGKEINLKDLEVAAENYYTDCIEVFFTNNSYMRQSFTEKLSKHHLENLLVDLVKQSRINKSEILISNAKVWETSKPNPPSSHFYIDKSKYEDLLQTLELNYFITKYNEQKDQDSRNVMSFYSLNYGLCVKENIHYGRGKDRKYVIQRRFNYNFLIEKFLEQAKSIECNNQSCAASFKMEQLDFLKMYEMLCPKCKNGTCEIKNVEVDLDEKPVEMLLLSVEYEILNSLRICPKQYPAELAQEIDCTVQKIRRIIDKLVDKGLVKRDKDGPSANARTIYIIEPKAQMYFNENLITV